MRYISDIQWLMCVSYFNGQCAYCGTTRGRLTADHLIPKSKGGQSDLSNIVPACEACNQSKADHEWREWLMSQEWFSQERMNKVYAWRRIAREAGAS